MFEEEGRERVKEVGGRRRGKERKKVGGKWRGRGERSGGVGCGGNISCMTLLGMHFFVRPIKAM